MRLLMVDDEELVLKSLERRLRRQPGVQCWTAPGVAEAIAILEAQPIDVLVTDIRMPGRDGTSLLGEVQERWPRIIRMVMSGHLDRRSWFKAVPLAHAVLSKPCSWDTLRTYLERSAAIQHRLAEVGVGDTLDVLGALPAVPGLFRKLNEAIADPRVGTAQVAQLVESEPAVAAQVLRIANSAWLGLPRQVADIREAINFLGMDLVRKLALSVGAFAALGKRARSAGLDAKAVQEHSVLVAKVASRLVDQDQAAVASTAGLLHDIGILALAAAFPRRWARAEAARLQGTPRTIAEMAEFGCSHADVGAYLLNQWGLPLPVVDAVAFHEEPPVEAGSLDVGGAVYVATRLADALADGHLWTRGPRQLDPTWLSQRNDPNEVQRWCLLMEAMQER